MTRIALDKLLNREETYKEFAEAARHPLNVEFTKAECYKRFKFLAEEVDEVLDAIDCMDDVDFDPLTVERAIELKANLLKELADVQYTLSGFAATFGLNLSKAYERVHASNMTKFSDDGAVYSADGKVLKPTTYRPPYLEDIL